MTPVLYAGGTTTYSTNGLGRLSDAMSCQVEEQLNGLYELTMVYPITGNRYDQLALDRIILAQAQDGGTYQPFKIYKISRPLNGLVTVNAEHISYALNGIVVMPYKASSCAQALSYIADNCINDCPFTFWTDKSVTGSFDSKFPRPVRGMLGGEEGSILDTYGKGEYEFDGYNVKLYVNRGSDQGVVIRYGKNLTELINDEDIDGVYTGIVPYWLGEDQLITLPERVIYSDHRSAFGQDIVKAVDMTDRWEEAPTEEQLRRAAQNYVANNEGWKINHNVKISFVPLWQTEEYKQLANLERVHMGDTVRVYYEALGVDIQAEVIRTKYDTLRERYIEIELGKKGNSLGKVLRDQIAPEIKAETTSYMETAIEHATKLITGANGGHVVMGTDANGNPNEIFIMDTEDQSTAVHVLRMNMNGIGFSDSGIDGPYDTAWTLDGSFVADYITSGTLSANVMRAGVIRDQSGSNYWNLDTGEMSISAESFIDTSNFVTQAQFKTAADKIATEVVEQVGSGIFFNAVGTDNGDNTVTIRAHVFLNRADATKTFSPYLFSWYKKTEDEREWLGYGYEITVNKSEYGYGGEVEAVFIMLEDRYPVNQQGRWVFSEEGSYSHLLTTQGAWLFAQGPPVVLGDQSGTADVYPVFGYDYYE